MAPTTVLIKSTTTNTTVNSSAPNTLTNNALSLSNGINGPTSSYFGVYQHAFVGSIDVSVRTLVPAAISTAPYRKALIVKLFFHQILALTDTSSVSFSDMMSTVASYFSLSTGSAERKAETAVVIIRSNFFLISNLQGIGLVLKNVEFNILAF